MDFKPLQLSDIPRLRPFLSHHPFRSCDFTVGGLFLWAGAFNYRYCITGDTLFIEGRTVNDTSLPAYSLPLGPHPLDESIEILRNHCRETGQKLVLSSVPEEALAVLTDLGANHIEQLTDWADYLYSAEALSTFAGKKLAKKRNHLNRFSADFPDAVCRPITADDIDTAKQFYESLQMYHNSPMALYDRHMTIAALDHLDELGFEGAVLEIPGRGIVAFTLGEVVGDTLHVHIEKMDHDVTGAGETICHRYTKMMTERHPGITLVNRQDDSGDMGLRRAKLALHPAFMLHKFNVAF